MLQEKTATHPPALATAPLVAAGPKTAQAAPYRIRCKGCDVMFSPQRVDQDFHSKACRSRWWAKARRRGGMVYELLCKLRVNRKIKGGTKGVLNQISAIVDGWIAEDKEAGVKTIGPHAGIPAWKRGL